MANQKNKAASPGYKTPNEKYNAEFAEESAAVSDEQARIKASNLASRSNNQSSK